MKQAERLKSAKCYEHTLIICNFLQKRSIFKTHHLFQQTVLYQYFKNKNSLFVLHIFDLPTMKKYKNNENSNHTRLYR